MTNFMEFMKGQKVQIPVTEGLDAISMLTDDAAVAAWNNEGLPPDRMSKENATILCNCERWPLMVDPQLQGIKWIKAGFQNFNSICDWLKIYLIIAPSSKNHFENQHRLDTKI